MPLEGVGTGERLADEKALSRHLHAFPVGLEQRVAVRIMVEEDARAQLDTFRKGFDQIPQ